MLHIKIHLEYIDLTGSLVLCWLKDWLTVDTVPCRSMCCFLKCAWQRMVCCCDWNCMTHCGCRSLQSMCCSTGWAWLSSRQYSVDQGMSHVCHPDRTEKIQVCLMFVIQTEQRRSRYGSCMSYRQYSVDPGVYPVCHADSTAWIQVCFMFPEAENMQVVPCSMLWPRRYVAFGVKLSDPRL